MQGRCLRHWDTSPARGEHPHAMTAAFGIPEEPEPGVIAIAGDKVIAVHLTRLKSDGSGKAEIEKPKTVHGRGPRIAHSARGAQ